MKKLVILCSIVLVASGALAFVFTTFRQSKNVVASSEIVQVSLLGDHADPSVVSVEKGKFVQFNTRDGKTHNIGQGSGAAESHKGHNESDDSHEHPAGGENVAHDHAKTEKHEHIEGAEESGTFGKDQSYRVQFNKTGTFTFHDHLNPKISIVVVVYEPDTK